jgi:hypothetical protein
MSCDCNTLVVGEAGPQGPQGLGGSNGTNGTNGLNAFTTTSANFTQPSSLGAAVTFYVVENRWIAIGQTIYISEAGFYTVTALGGSPLFSSVTANLISTDGVSVGGTVTTGRKVSPSAKAVYSAPLSSLTVTTGGVSSLDGPVTINESGNNSDVRIEGFGDTHLLYCDANAGTTGRVGISTSTPSAKLHVDGTFKVGDVGSAADAEFTKGAVFNSLQSGTGADGDFQIKTRTQSNTFFVNALKNSVGIGTNDPDKLLDVNGAAEMNTLLVNPGGVAADPSFQVYGTSGTRPITVLSTNAPFNGVGIFKTTPTVALDVVGAATVTGATILGSTLAVTGNLSVATNVLKVDSSGTFVGINKTTPTVALDVVGATAISGNLSVATNVLKVNSSGPFVGINKTTPTVALDVVGALAVSGASALTTLGVSGDVSVASGVLQVDTANTRVGINDATPSSTLDVNGTASFVGNVNVGTLLYAKPGVGVGVNKEFPAVALDVTGAANISGNLTVATDDLIVDTTNHKVGINIGSPSTDLHVAGITQSDSGFRIENQGSSNATLTQFKYGGASYTKVLAAGGTTNTTQNFTISVPNAALGDFVQVTYNTTIPTNADVLTLFGYVSSAGQVTVVISNNSDTAVSSQSYELKVLLTRAIAST